MNENEVCPYCGDELHVLDHFFSSACENCGEDVIATKKICPNCGYPHCFTQKE